MGGEGEGNVNVLGGGRGRLRLGRVGQPREVVKGTRVVRERRKGVWRVEGGRGGRG